MRWGKVVLLFQAVMTLIVGMAFLFQVISLDSKHIAELKVDVHQGLLLGDGAEVRVIDLKERYSVASYALLIVGLIELMILTRLMS